jgi:hypothetical protein
MPSHERLGPDDCENLQKVRAGEIKLPLVRLEKSQKAAKGVSLNDLATY